MCGIGKSVTNSRQEKWKPTEIRDVQREGGTRTAAAPPPPLSEGARERESDGGGGRHFVRVCKTENEEDEGGKSEWLVY